jgi:hypothetical protein
MLSMLVFNIIFILSVIAMTKGIVTLRAYHVANLKRMKAEEAVEDATLVNQAIPMRKSELEVFQSLPRSKRRKIKAEFKSKVKKGIMIQVSDQEGNIGYVQRKEYLNKIK